MMDTRASHYLMKWKKTSKKAQLDGGKDQAKKKEQTIVLPIKRVQTRASSGKN